MTTGREAPLGAVRPLRARVVRPEHAADHVAPMAEVSPASGPALDARPAVFDPDAYEESGPAFYVYRLRRGTEEHTGIVAEVGIEAFLDGGVRGHEAVQPARLEALVRHYAAGAVRTELVALLHRPVAEVATATAEALHGEPMLRFTDAAGWEQEVWPVPASATAVLAAELSRLVHYVADGHHRVAANLSLWRAAGQPDGTGVMCVLHPFGGLRISAFHRRVAGPVAASELLDRLSPAFAVHPLSTPDERSGCFAVYVGGKWYDVTYGGARPPGARGLDVSLLDDLVLEPMLGSPSGRAARVEIVPDVADLAGLVDACDRDGGALFAMRPPALEQLVEVADRGEVMPPKSTYFAPKPWAGVFLRQ